MVIVFSFILASCLFKGVLKILDVATASKVTDLKILITMVADDNLQPDEGTEYRKRDEFGPEQAEVVA